MKRYLIFIGLIILFFSCSEENLKNKFPIYEIEDRNYPSTYCLLNENEILELETSIQVENDGCFEVDSFGFIKLKDYHQCNIFNGDFTSGDSVLKFIKTIIANNQLVTGVTDTSLLEINLKYTPKYIEGTTNKWTFKFKNQVFSGIEIYETKIWCYVFDDGKVRLYGHWYPVVYIPSSDKVSFTEAKQRLVGKEFGYADWGGSKSWIISEDDFYKDDSPQKVIYPFRNGDCIELRVCWFVTSKSIWNFFIDTSTGELINKEQTIIF